MGEGKWIIYFNNTWVELVLVCSESGTASFVGIGLHQGVKNNESLGSKCNFVQYKTMLQSNL